MDTAVEKTKAKPKQKPKEKKSKKAELPAGFVMMPSKFLDETLVAVTKEYETYWKDRDESSNFKQEVSQNLIVEKVRENFEVSLRQQIDEQMRNELEILTLAVDKMKFAKPKKPKKKPKKAEKRKDPKKKKIKDLTPNADIDDLYTELVRNDILKRVSHVSLRDFRGEMNLVTDQENNGQECKPDLGDIRKMLFDFVVLPMSSSTVRANVPLTKSLLLVGPRGSGKKMLVQAVCNELGANLFDLTAANIRGRYIDPDEQVMLMHLVLKVGRILAPSIIFIDDCDLMFTKKLPPEINYNPARMKGNLIKAMKTIGPEDRIMLIGASSKPFNAAKAPMFKLYERIICLYPPAYPSRYTLWESSIKDMGGLITKYLLISTLAQISKNFTALDIMNVTQEVLSSRRIKQQNAKSLNTSEFGHRLAQYNPVLGDELQALDNWMKETPLAKKRVEIMALIEAGKNVFNKV